MKKIVATIILSAFCLLSADAAQIGQFVETDIWEQTRRFFSLRDSSLRIVLLGCILLGINCGIMGSYVVVRKMALIGDTLSHAVLPGIALGFLWSMTKNPLAILIGATLVGILGVLTVNWLTATTRLKQDTAMGIVLSSFYAIGIALMQVIQRLPTGNKSGLQQYLFGQASAISPADLTLMLIITALSIACVWIFYHRFLTLSFDRVYAGAIGLPIRWLNYLIMLLTTFAIIIAMQAVGVVLVSAMLIIPAATAYLLTDRFHRMVFYSTLIGVITAIVGAYLSFLNTKIPTGAVMVVSAAVVFGIVFCIAPRHGWLSKKLRLVSRTRRILHENILKSIYRNIELGGFREEGVLLEKISPAISLRDLHNLNRAGLVTSAGDMVHLTPSGYESACRIVRNHRLWELYLTDIANYAPDHVHDDAEEIEHVLGEKTVLELERSLSYPHTDPHGKPIPSLRDIDDDLPNNDANNIQGYA